MSEPVDIAPMRRRFMKREALRRVSLIETDYRQVKRVRREAWEEAAELGATYQEIANAANVARTIVSGQLEA